MHAHFASPPRLEHHQYFPWQVASDHAQLAQLLKAGPRAEEASAPPPPHALLEAAGEAVATKSVAYGSAPATPEPGAVQDARSEPDAAVQGGRRLSRELAVLFWRTLTGIWRNPALLLLHWGLAIASGLLAGVIFFQVGAWAQVGGKRATCKRA